MLLTLQQKLRVYSRQHMLESMVPAGAATTAVAQLMAVAIQGYDHPPDISGLATRQQPGGAQYPDRSLARDASRLLTGIGGLEHLVLRTVMIIVIAAETAFESNVNGDLASFIRNVQQADEFVTRKRYLNPEGNTSLAGEFRQVGARPARGSAESVPGADRGQTGPWEIDRTGILRRKGKVWVSKSDALRTEIISRNYNSP
jgi:hypothetical protein